MRNLYPKGPVPTSLPLARIEVWHHDSGMLATHNFPCPVCHDKGAILFLNDGRFYPCDPCKIAGWRTVRLSEFWLWVLRTFRVIR